MRNKMVLTCIECGAWCSRFSMVCYICAKRLRRRESRCKVPDPEWWQEKIRRMSDRAAQGLPLFDKADKQYVGMQRGRKIARTVRCNYKRTD